MNKLIELARKYGETSQEEFNLTDCINFLENEGYQLFPLYLDFIAQYGGIMGYHSAHKNHEAAPGKFNINPVEASNTIYIERVETYEERTSCRLIPFGQCSNQHIVLMLGDNGKIYGGFDEYLFQYGDDISSGFDILINGKGPLGID